MQMNECGQLPYITIKILVANLYRYGNKKLQLKRDHVLTGGHWVRNCTKSVLWYSLLNRFLRKSWKELTYGLLNFLTEALFVLWIVLFCLWFFCIYYMNLRVFSKKFSLPSVYLHIYLVFLLLMFTFYFSPSIYLLKNESSLCYLRTSFSYLGRFERNLLCLAWEFYFFIFLYRSLSFVYYLRISLLNISCIGSKIIFFPILLPDLHDIRLDLFFYTRWC